MYTVNYNKSIILFHGSRGGIDGEIKPISRKRCDFGQGFYLCTNPEQAKSLVSNDSEPYFYQIRLNLPLLNREKILEIDGMDWAYFVLYNRGRLEKIKDTSLYKQISKLGNEKDLIIGPIADDAMNDTMRLFVNNQITDKAFLESIKVIDYDVQYVAKTIEACRCLEIVSSREMYGKELDEARYNANERRSEGNHKASDIQKVYRREGKYLDEILDEYIKDRGKSYYDR